MPLRAFVFLCLCLGPACIISGNLGSQTAPNGLPPEGSAVTSGPTRGLPQYQAIRFRSLSAAGSVVCGVTPEGAAFCWGTSESGALGDGKSTELSTPAQVIGLSQDVASLSVGLGGVCALMRNERVRCWGSTTYTDYEHSVAGEQKVPFEATLLGGGIKRLMAGSLLHCALDALGTMQCFGNFMFRGAAKSTPTPTVWATQVKNVVLGDGGGCLQFQDGKTMCFSEWNSSILPSTPNALQPTPTSPVFDSATELSFSEGVCGRGQDEQWYCASTDNWLTDIKPVSTPLGANGIALVRAVNGQQVVVDLNGDVFVTPFHQGETKIIRGSGVAWSNLVGGAGRICGLSTDERALCWGSGLLLGRALMKTHQPDVVELPAPIEAIHLSGTLSCARDNGQRTWCWGTPAVAGLFGLDSRAYTHPVEVKSIRSWAQSEKHACFIELDGSLYCIGENRRGQVGVRDSLMYEQPVRVAGNIQNWADVQLASESTCARTTDGDVYCFGANDHGQLGDNTTEDRFEPTRILAEYGPIRVHAITDRGGAAITDDGRLVSWYDDREPRVPTSFERLTAVHLAASSQVLCWTDAEPEKTPLRLSCLGGRFLSNPGQLFGEGVWRGLEQSVGQWLTVERDAPCWAGGPTADCASSEASVQLSVADDSIAEMSSGTLHSCLRLVSGRVVCWGNAMAGQLGNGMPESEIPLEVRLLP